MAKFIAIEYEEAQTAIWETSTEVERHSGFSSCSCGICVPKALCSRFSFQSVFGNRRNFKKQILKRGSKIMGWH